MADGPDVEQSPETLAKPHMRGCAPDLPTLLNWLKADLYRYSGRLNAQAFVRHFLFTPGYKYTVWMRTTGYLKRQRWAKYSLYPAFKFILLRTRYKYGIAIPEYTEIGPGLFINRFGGIMINGDAKIGKNCNLSFGITIGQSNRGKRFGSPTIGDRVYIASGARVIGSIKIGDEALIGVNSVVVRDVPAKSVVGGTPARIISKEGTTGYVNRTWN